MEINTEELIREVKRIRILTRRLLDERLSGDYHSVFKGQGIEFDEARPYQPGDDVRTIDWNVTARTGEPYIKRFSEERELTVLFMVDVSGSQSFGTNGRSKAMRAAELTALLAMTAMANNDKVGLVLFSNRVIQSIPPRKGQTAVQRLVREVLAAEETREGTDIREALRFVSATQRRKAVVFLVSDFQDSDYEKDLTAFARRHDVIACRITDPAERELPNVGIVELLDPESNQTLLVDTSSPLIRQRFAAEAEANRQRESRLFLRAGIDLLDIDTDQPYIDAVRDLFRCRALRRH
ncbi:MAG: DUF58 domain-containing protein [Kiritimatiellae bacterium]|nr:DUF58 domain-containing protein [Kiritimatiellia bacterium]